MTSFIDTHCHLDKLELTPEEAVKQAKQKGVETMVTISVDEDSFDFVSNTVMRFKDGYGTVGLHPHDASKFSPSLEQSIRELVLGNNKMIAIGETGLDYHYMNSSSEDQQFAFRNQLQLAFEASPK